MHKNRIVFILLFFFFCVAGKVIAEDDFPKYGVTLGNPWLGVKYTPLSLLSLEFRTTFDPEVKIASFRGNCIFCRKNPFQVFAGLEYGMIKFNMPDISGSGTMITPFFGSEYAISHRLSLAADIGYSWIRLESGNASLSGPEYVFNIWLVLYPFAKPKEAKKPASKTENIQPRKVTAPH